MPDIDTIKATALREVRQEQFREAVEKEKQRLREHRSFIDRIFPYSIIIVKKERN